MTEKEHQLWVEKCGWILHHLLVEIRALSWQAGNEQRINDLADLAHNVPLFMIGRDSFVHEYLRKGFLELASKYLPKRGPDADRYISIIDMDEVTFSEVFRRTSFVWPEIEKIVG
jgi:hypothetical protein